MVGNNTPVFFIRDPMKFQHFIRSQKRRADNNLRDHKDDDDFGQAGTLVRKVMDNAQRDRLVSNVVGHLKNGVTEPVLARAIEYWRNVDQAVGDRIAKGVQGERMAAE